MPATELWESSYSHFIKQIWHRMSRGSSCLCFHTGTRPVLFLEDYLYHPGLLDWQNPLTVLKTALTVYIEEDIFSKCLQAELGIFACLLAKHVLSKTWCTPHAHFQSWHFRRRDAEPRTPFCVSYSWLKAKVVLTLRANVQSFAFSCKDLHLVDIPPISFLFLYSGIPFPIFFLRPN